LQIAGTGIDNQARAVELLGVFSRILEACGGGLEPKAENARLVGSSTTALEHRASGI
jgi:hypothetical protein